MKTIYLKGDVGFEITAEGIKNLVDFTSKSKLRVLVNSPGGSVIEAYEIYNMFKLYPGEVEFVIFPFAASAMSYIIMAGKKRSGCKNSIFMAHKAQGLACGDSDEMAREAELLKGLDNIIAEAYMPVLGGSREEILSKMKNEIWMIGWEQLTDGKVIDNVIDNIDDIIEELSAEEKNDIIETSKESASVDFIKVKVEQSKLRLKKESDKFKLGLEKIAAKIQEFNPALIENHTSAEDDNNIQEVNMTLKEFLDSNPEAQAEYEKNLQAARDEVIKKSEEKTNSDRKRISNILDLAGVKLPDIAIKALEEGLEVGEYAKAELERQKNIRVDAKPSIFGNLKIAQTPGDHSPDEKKTAEEFDKKASAAVANYFKTKEGK